jgi:hypothetical protein
MAMTAEDPEARRRIAAFEQGLRDLRWHEGRNIHIDYRWAADDPDRLHREAAALAAAAPDVILANSTPVLAALPCKAPHCRWCSAGDRSDRQRLSCPSWHDRWQYHRLHQFRVRYRRQVAADAQGGRAPR